MPRFVVLTHDHPQLHWDLMLEEGDVLRTWRLASPPTSSGPIDAEALPDHRPMYLDYEGPVGDNRGTVTRFDSGTYELVQELPDSLVVRLFGIRLNCTAMLVRAMSLSKWLFTLDAPKSES